MATNFGFNPVTEGKRYFISYKNEDAGKVAKIAFRLNEMGVPLWYDYGLEKGEIWYEQISKTIRDSEAVILFATKMLFSVDDTWVRKEFEVAKMYHKKIYVVWLDDINPYVNPESVSDKLKSLFVDLNDLQGIKATAGQPEQIAWRIATELIRGNFTQSQGNASGASKSAKQSGGTKASSGRRSPFIILIALLLAVAVLEGIVIRNLWVKGLTQEKETTSSLGSDDISGESDVLVPSTERYYTFGNYPQGANGERASVEWRVLEVKKGEGKALLVSRKQLDCRVFSEDGENTSWETCSLRQWLNKEFLDEAFTAEEQEKIVGDKDKQEKIFLLSLDDVTNYFTDDADRVAILTDYASSYNIEAKDYSSGGKVFWSWLCSPGGSSEKVALVGTYGNLAPMGLPATSLGCVRPAFWLKYK